MSETATEATTETTQDAGSEFDGEFDADKAKKLIDALRAEKKSLQGKVRDSAPSLAKLAALEASQQTEAERQTAALTEAQQRAERAERAALRASVALRKGLPADLASRLQGDDEDSLEADADVLLSLIPANTTPRAPRPDRSQGSSANGGGAVTPANEFAALIRKQTGR